MTTGFKEPLEFDPGDQLRVRGKASRFRATPKLLANCAECGITPQNATEHFAYTPPEHPAIGIGRSHRQRDSHNPLELRKKDYFLTDKGRSLIHKFKRALST
jgi:hypothetical protein